MKKIREEWESYRRNVIPPGAGSVQINETRLAFFGGAQAMLSLLFVCDRESQLEAYRAELEEFVNQYKASQGLKGQP